ncbi:pancreatic triacylglycerol lipase-like [Maniola jurtina]|uniref:pancreatic triacylglycerol lipase-like n=1 Tax=Maniola jurtina TaxID=191418 RepID=UPI001E68CC19|nr:pancreatic triacylglycerol lipase-like [Maniola jurtina]
MCAMFKLALVMCVFVTAHGFNLGPTQIVFHLFTRQNPTQSEPLLPTQASILASTFDYDRRTVITIHSYKDSVAGNFNAHLVPAYLAVEDLNVLAVDWTPGASNYVQGLSNVPQVGAVIAQFVNLLADFGYNTANIRIVGVGLGGHAAGVAARRTTGTIPHIIALDPSLHGWTYSEHKLTKNDAQLVEVIHTTAGHYGYDEPLGDIDFYPNGGSWQTGCGGVVSCSHTYAFVFYAESLRAEIPSANAPRFIGTACNSLEEATSLVCDGARDAVFGGNLEKSNVSGIYSFVTNITPPFARD